MLKLNQLEKENLLPNPNQRAQRNQNHPNLPRRARRNSRAQLPESKPKRPLPLRKPLNKVDLHLKNQLQRHPKNLSHQSLRAAKNLLLLRKREKNSEINK